MSSSLRTLLLVAALVGGCLLPESTLIQDTKSAASSVPSESEAGARGNAASGVERATRGDAATRDDAGGKCVDMDDDAGRSEQGACCTEPLPCYEGAKATRAVGRCQSGTRACQFGRLGACKNSLLPRAEACDNQGSDDDCDGQVDNVPGLGSACTPAQSANACGGGALGCVVGQVEPVCIADEAPVERCNGTDDDCDMKVDETFDLMKDRMNCGSCATRCDSTQACCGGKCTVRGAGPDGCEVCSAMLACGDGEVCCEGACVDMQTDRNHCGACGKTCAAQQTCCGGSCVDPRADESNCGACGMVCDAGMMPTCCAGSCVDVAVDRRNCGACGNSCGVVCSCEPNSGEPQCMGPLAVCF